MEGESHKLSIGLSHAELPGYPVSWYSSPDARRGPWKEHVVSSVDYCHTLQAADFNGDGHMDVLAGAMPGSRHQGLRIYLGNGGAKWWRYAFQTRGAYNAIVGDIDNDNDPDVVTVHNWDSGPTALWRNRR